MMQASEILFSLFPSQVRAHFLEGMCRHCSGKKSLARHGSALVLHRMKSVELQPYLARTWVGSGVLVKYR